MLYTVIPIHNRKECTRECLGSLSTQSYKGFKIIVVDDGSTDGSSDMIQRDFPEVILLHGDGKLWWSGATNLGVRYALDRQADYVMTLNDDTIARPDYVEKMMYWATRAPNALIGASALSAETQEPIYGGIIIRWKTGRSEDLLQILPPEKWHGLHKVSYLPGRGMLVPAEVFRRIGLYDAKRFPHYAADYDFTHRAARAGYGIFCNHDAKLLIFPEASGDALLRKRKSIKNYYDHLFGMKGGGNLKRFVVYAFRNCPRKYLAQFIIIGTLRRVFGYPLDWLREAFFSQLGQYNAPGSPLKRRSVVNRPGAIEPFHYQRTITSVIRVGWLQSVVPRYHIPFLERLSTQASFDVTCYHGRGKVGKNVQSVGAALPVRSVWVKNRFWPFGHGRIFWQSGVRDLLRGNYDVVVLTEAIHNLSIWGAWGLRRVFKKPIVLYGFGYRSVHRAGVLSWFHDSLRKVLLRSADAVIVYTERGRAECLRDGLNPGKIFVSGNTLDTEYLMSLENTIEREELTALRTRLGIEGHRVLLYVGRLYPAKRLDVLIDSFRLLQTGPGRFSLVIIGGGSEFEKLFGHGDDLKDVHFLGPLYDERELAKFFVLSDLFVIPAAVGLGCVHAFCYGLPVVTTNPSLPKLHHGPEVDYIRHRENGYFVEELNAMHYAQAIRLLLTNVDQYKSMQSKARETARSLSIRNMVAAFVSAVEYARDRKHVLQSLPRGSHGSNAGADRARTS